MTNFITDNKHRRRTRCMYELPEPYERGSGDSRPGKRKGQWEPPCSVDDCLTLISQQVRQLKLHEKQNPSEEPPATEPESIQHGDQQIKDDRTSGSDGESSAPYRKYPKSSCSEYPSVNYNERNQSASHKERSAVHQQPSPSHQQPNTSYQQPSASYSQYPSTSYDEPLPSYEEECGNDEELCAIYKKQSTIHEGPSVRSSVGCLQLDNASPPSHKKTRHCDTGSGDAGYYDLSDRPQLTCVDEKEYRTARGQRKGRKRARRAKLSFGQIEDEHLCYRLQNLTLDDKREMATGKKRKFDDFQQDEVSVKIRRLPG